MDAEDAVTRGEMQRKDVPRYAAFSAWHPLSTVRRDPIAVCDSRSVKPEGYAKMSYRAVSDRRGSGEYHLEAAWLLPPGEGAQQRWYWCPEQRPDEVLFIKFADTQAEVQEGVSAGVDDMRGDPLKRFALFVSQLLHIPQAQAATMSRGIWAIRPIARCRRR